MLGCTKHEAPKSTQISPSFKETFEIDVEHSFGIILTNALKTGALRTGAFYLKVRVRLTNLYKQVSYSELSMLRNSPLSLCPGNS